MIARDEEETKCQDDKMAAETSPRRTSRGDSCQWSTAESCVVCFGEYAYGEHLCRLPCRHVYHAECIDEWLDGANHAWCPLCKLDLLSEQEHVAGPESDTRGSSRPAVNVAAPAASAATTERSQTLWGIEAV